MKQRSSKQSFSKASSPVPTEAELALQEWGIVYLKLPDDSLYVVDLDISNKKLTQLPDLSAVEVGGDFRCNNNQLASLKGAPQIVGGGVFCDNNYLTSLEHAPQAFRELASDFGKFHSWGDIPENLLTPPVISAPQEHEATQATMALKSSINISLPLKLKDR